MTIYPLQDILQTFADKKGNRRILFNLGAIGGINTNIVKLIMISLPFVEYALIFNPWVFEYLGIATAIIFYIIFLSVVMIVVFVIGWFIKKNVIKKITPSWENYFEGKDLSMVLSSGVTPYSDFYKHYSELLSQNLSEDELYNGLIKAFKSMEKENAELISVMNRNNKSDK